MSGRAPYGYKPEPTVMEGIRTKMMTADPEAAERVKLMFEMYSEPQTSFGDIAGYFAGNGGENDREFSRVTLSQIFIRTVRPRPL